MVVRRNSSHQRSSHSGGEESAVMQDTPYPITLKKKKGLRKEEGRKLLYPELNGSRIGFVSGGRVTILFGHKRLWKRTRGAWGGIRRGREKKDLIGAIKWGLASIEKEKPTNDLRRNALRCSRGNEKSPRDTRGGGQLHLWRLRTREKEKRIPPLVQDGKSPNTKGGYWQSRGICLGGGGEGIAEEDGPEREKKRSSNTKSSGSPETRFRPPINFKRVVAGRLSPGRWV